MNSLWFNLFGLNRLMVGWVQLALMGGMALASALAKNKAKNRETQNAAVSNENDQRMRLQQARQQALVNLLLGEANQNFRNADIDLEQRKFALDAPGTRGKQALFGSLMQNLQPAKLTGLSPKLAAKMPTITGGLTADAISPQARQMGGLMQQNAVAGQQAGDRFAPIPQVNFRQGLLPDPMLQGYKGPGKGESILGLIGLAGQIYEQYQNQQNGDVNYGFEAANTSYSPVIPGSQFGRNA